MSQAPSIVATLIERFEQNRDAYKSQSYNETQVRREFLDPFFEALGWDVANKQGHAEAYKDVIHEDAIKIGGNTKAPDYCFRIGGARKFFLEAKKPAVNVNDEIPPAYQLRRYAWSAKLPLSILTDFEEFAVYDCRTRPNPSARRICNARSMLPIKRSIAWSMTFTACRKRRLPSWRGEHEQEKFFARKMEGGLDEVPNAIQCTQY